MSDQPLGDGTEIIKRNKVIMVANGGRGCCASGDTDIVTGLLITLLLVATTVASILEVQGILEKY